MGEKLPDGGEVEMSDEVRHHYLLRSDPLAVNDLRFPDEPGGELSGDREPNPAPLNPLKGSALLGAERSEKEE